MPNEKSSASEFSETRLWSAESITIPPITLFGIPRLVFMRIVKSLLTWPTWRGWAETAGLLAMLLMVAYLISQAGGWYEGRAPIPWRFFHEVLLMAFLVPALSEELICRAAIIPHPSEAVPRWLVWLGITTSMTLYIAVHPLNGWLNNRPLFLQWDYIFVLALLAAVLTIVYLRTGSLWPSVIIHTIVAAVFSMLYG